MLHAFGEVELLSFYTSMKLGLGKKTKRRRQTHNGNPTSSHGKLKKGLWEARLHLTVKSQGLVAYLLMHIGDRREDTEEGTGWGEKERRRANIKKNKTNKIKPTTSGEPQRDRNPGSNSCDRAGWAERVNLFQAWDTSRTVVVLLQR